MKNNLPKKPKTKYTGDMALEEKLNFVLSKIEQLKMSTKIDEMIPLLGEELDLIGIKSLISAVRADDIFARYLNLGNKTKLFRKKDLILSDVEGYEESLSQKSVIFLENRPDRIKKILQRNGIKAQWVTNSIIAPLFISESAVAFVELFSNELGEADKKKIEDFTNKLGAKLANFLFFQQISTSKERYENLFEKAEVGFAVIDPKKKTFVNVNKKLLQITRHSKVELLKMNYHEIIDEPYKKEFMHFIESSGKKDTEEKLMNADIRTGEGNIRNIEFKIIYALGKEEVFLEIKDITLQKRVAKLEDKAEMLEHTIEQTEEKYKNLIENANDGIVVINKKGYITFSNKAFFEISGYEQNNLGDIHLSGIIHPDDYKDIVKIFNKAISGVSAESEYNEFRALKKNGEVFYISFSSTPIRENGQVCGLQAIIRNITEKKLLEKRLEESRKHYKQVIDTIDDSICVIGSDFKLVSWNKAFQDRVNRSDLVGKKCNDILPKFYPGLRDSHICKPGEWVDNIFSTGRAAVFTHRSKNESGNRFHKIKLFPVFKENQVFQAVLTIRDITERKKAEEELRRLSEFNKRILDNAPVSIIAIDKHGVIVSGNKTSQKMMDRSEKEYAGRNLLATNSIKNNKDLVKKYKKLLKEGRSFHYENLPYLTAASNKIIYLNIIAAPLYDKNNELDGAISMAVDNTEAVKAREKLRDLNLHLEKKVEQRTYQLDQANTKLKQVLDMKSKFLADASHELRTPLTIIQGNIDLLIHSSKLNGDDSDIRDVYSMINDEIQKMSHLLSDLTALSGSETTKPDLNISQIDLNSFLDEIIRVLAVLARKKKQRIEFTKDPKGVLVTGDEEKLDKLFLNIIRNSLKYTPEGGRIKIWTEKNKRGVNVFVEDNGIGIPEKDLPHVFERFYRVDKARTHLDDEGGTGLGLSICKWVVDLHKGKINIDSKEGKYTKVEIFLPYNLEK
jgi:PAS domain S-box-containing protein